MNQDTKFMKGAAQAIEKHFQAAASEINIRGKVVPNKTPFTENFVTKK